MKSIFHGAGYEECSAKEFFLSRGLNNISFSIIGCPIYGATEMDGLHAYLIEVRGLQTKDGLLARFFLWPCNYAAIDNDIRESMIIDDCIIRRPLVISPDGTMIYNKPRWVKLILQDKDRGEIIMNGPSINPLEANGENFSSPGECACFWDTTQYRPDILSTRGVLNWPVRQEPAKSNIIYNPRHHATNYGKFILVESNVIDDNGVNHKSTFEPLSAASPEDLQFLPEGESIQPAIVRREMIHGPGSLIAKPPKPVFWEGIGTDLYFSPHGGLRPTPFAGPSSWQSCYLASVYFPSIGIKRPRFKWRIVKTKNGIEPNIEVSGCLYYSENVKVLIPPPGNTPQSFFDLFENKDDTEIEDFILCNEQIVNEEYSDYEVYANTMMEWIAYDAGRETANAIL